ncbi:MAG: ArnT family glycosyltransferase [Chloroflexota bacterium]
MAGGRTLLAILAGAVLTVLALAPRIIATDVFITTDELFWLGRSGNFARALSQGRFDQTFLTGHPGVPTMWTAVTSLGIERAQTFAGPRREISRREVSQQPDFVPALASARQGVGAVTGISVLFLAGLTWKLYGPLSAALAGGLLAYEPFLLAHSRFLHIDAELASFVSLAVLAAIAGWTSRMPGWIMVGSGMATGLALLAKAPASLLLGFIPLLGLLLCRPNPLRQRRIWMLGTIWAAATVITYLAVWPAMWSAPGTTLAQVLAFMRDNSNPQHVLGPMGEERASVGPLFYVHTLLLRMSPVTLIGVIMAIVACLMIPGHERRAWRMHTAAILGFALSFGLLMTFAAKNFDRYLLPVFPLLAVVGGFGWASALCALAPRAPRLASGLGGLIILIHATLAFSAAPYYLTFFNPLAGGAERGTRLIAAGWGEGLDQVAAFLNAQPNAPRLRVGLPGEIYTTVLGAQTRGQVMPADDASATAYDYLVVYVRNRQLGEASPAMDEQFQTWHAEHVVRLQGIDYAWIYNTRNGAPIHLSFTDGSILRGYSTSSQRIRSGQSLQLSLFWSNVSDGHSVEARLTGPNGHVESAPPQSLSAPGTDAGPARVMLNTGMEAPAGAYVVSVRLLDRIQQTIQPSNPVDTGWVPLRTIEIRPERR